MQLLSARLLFKLNSTALIEIWRSCGRSIRAWTRNISSIANGLSVYNKKYFEINERIVLFFIIILCVGRYYIAPIFRETGCKWFDVHHSFFTTAVQLNDMAKTSDVRTWAVWCCSKMNDSLITQEEDIYARLSESLAYNAFNFVESNNIVILAPTFFPLLHNSSGTTMVGICLNEWKYWLHFSLLLRATFSVMNLSTRS